MEALLCNAFFRIHIYLLIYNFLLIENQLKKAYSAFFQLFILPNR